jgi:amino acid transporter
MAILVELGVGILVFLAEVSVLAALGLILPFRFVCSPAFRKKKRTEWESSPKKKFSDIASSLVSFVAVAACAYWWMDIFIGSHA